MLYEINYLVLQSKTSELEKIREEMKKTIESFDAKITAEREYLKRKLSYEINHERYGFFTVIRFEIKNGEQIQELRKNLNINGNISRYIIVRAAELPTLEEQSEKESDIQRKDTLKQDEIEKALAQEAKKSSSPKKKEQEEKTAEIDSEDKHAEEKRELEKDINSEEEKTEEESKEEEKEEKEEDEKEGKVSLDELDKKLDEILNL